MLTTYRNRTPQLMNFRREIPVRPDISPFYIILNYNDILQKILEGLIRPKFANISYIYIIYVYINIIFIY